jgi:tetratricopeptide (TPR) repeat protein
LSIERRNAPIEDEKLNHLLQKLGLNLDDLSDFYLQEEQIDEEAESEELQLRLISIESIIDLSSPEEGLEELRGLGISHAHPLSVWVPYLRGKIYYYKKNWKKAHKYFFDCIHSIQNQYPEMAVTNLRAICYHELSLIEYILNNLQQALKYSQEALKVLLPDGEKSYIRDFILISKAIYLQKLNRFEEAQHVLEELTQKRGVNDPAHESSFFSESKEVILNLYEVQATILRQGRMHTQAIRHALKGIDLARIDRMYDRAFELWTTLGSIYNDQNKLKLAEICFLTALKFKKLIKKEKMLAYVYTQLGFLYEKDSN